MTDTQLTRIYDLKTQGVDSTLADINKIISRVEYLGQVKNTIFKSGAMFGIGEVFKQANADLQQQTDLQVQMLENLKNINTGTERSIGIQERMAVTMDGILTVQKNINLNMADQAGKSNIQERVIAMNNELKIKAQLNKEYQDYKKSLADIAKEHASTAAAAEKSANKQMADGEKLAASVEQQNLKIAKDNIDIINQEVDNREKADAKQMADGEKLAAFFNSEIEKETSLREKQAAATAKMETALSRLKAEYKAAYEVAQELGAQQVFMQREVDDMQGQRSKNGIFSGFSEGDIKTKEEDIAKLTPVLKDAQDKALNLSKALHGIELATGQGQRNVGQYNEAVRGLKDILRDSPAFANSFQTGLMGISNNIPMFLDGVKKMREENKLLVSQGKEPIDIISTLSEGIFEVGTMATIAVTALTMLVSAFHNTEDSSEKLKASNKELIQSFEELGSTILEFDKEFEGIVRSFKQFTLPGQDAFDDTTDAIKRQASEMKALGIINEEAYKFEKEQLEINQKLRASELEDITKKKSVYNDLIATLDKAQSARAKAFEEGGPKVPFGDSKEVAAIKKVLDSAGLSRDIVTKLKADIDKADKSGADLAAVLLDARKKYQFKVSEVDTEAANKEQEIKNAQIEFDTKYRLMAEAKHKELNTNIIRSDEEMRLLNEKQYIESVDRITNDVLSKYEIMYDALRKERDQYVKSNPGDGESVAKYEKLLANLRIQADLERQNQVNAFLDQQAMAAQGYNSSEKQSAAGIANNAAKSSGPQYDSYKKYLDANAADKEAKLTQETAAFDALYDQYYKAGRATEEITRQHELKMQQIEKDSYSQRLSIANTFFKVLTEETDKVASILTENIDTELLNKLTALTQKGGNKDVLSIKRDMTEAQGVIDKAQATLRAIETKLPEAQRAQNKDLQALNAAKSDDERLAANTNLLLIEKEIADLLNQQAKANNDIANATERINAKKEEQRRQVRQTLTDGAVDIAKSAADAEMQVLAAQDASRDRSAQKQLAWNQKLLNAQTQSKAQQLANEKAYAVQEEQMAKEKAQRDQRRAKQQMIIEYAAAALKIVAANIWNPAQWPQMAAEEAVLAGVYLSKLAILSSAPAYATGTGDGTHPGGTAIVGDGGRSEVVQVGDKYYTTPSTPTPVNLPAGAKVFPSITEVTNMNSFAYSGSMGAQLKAPAYFAGNAGGGSSSSAGGGQQFADIAASFSAIQNVVGSMMEGLQNMNVNLDTNKVSSRINYNLTKKVSI